MSVKMLGKLRAALAHRYRRIKSPMVVNRVRDQGLTYLEHAALTELFQTTREVEVADVKGIILEAGCALGGSAIVIAAAKARIRPLRVYDVFGMIPPPSKEDGPDVHMRYAIIASGKAQGIQGSRYYGYEENLRDKVAATFDQFGLTCEENQVQLIPGRFEDTLKVNEPVALAHIDCDWYDSVRICLERIVPHLALGGKLIIDDYDAWSGCRKAVDEYFDLRRDSFCLKKRARLQITRISS